MEVVDKIIKQLIFYDNISILKSERERLHGKGPKEKIFMIDQQILGNTVNVFIIPFPFVHLKNSLNSRISANHNKCIR